MTFHLEHKTPSVVMFASEVLDMHYEVERLRQEVAELKKYRDDYFELLNSNIAHNEAMMGHILVAALNGGFSSDHEWQPKHEDQEVQT